MNDKITSREIDRRKFLGIGAGVFGAAALGMGIAACGNSTTANSASGGAKPAGPLGTIQKNGLKLAYITNPPFSYADPSTGKVIGAGPVVLTEILKNVGITNLSYTLVPFASLIPQISSGRSDMSACNFNAAPARCDQVAFTNPVALYHQGALVRKGNPKNLHSYNDIANNKSVRIAILRGDASIAWLASYGVGTSRLLQFDTLPQAVTAVNQGRADVYLNAVVSLNQELKTPEGSNLEVASPFKGPVINGQEIITNACYALRYNEVDLLNAVNEQIAAMIKNGRMATLLAPYGYPASAIPPATMTAKSICPAGHWPAGYKDLSQA